MIRIRVEPGKAIQVIRDARIRSTQKLREAVAAACIDLANYIKEQKLSGQVLKNRTGTLRRAVRAIPPAGYAEGTIRGEVVVDRTASKYGKVQEYGGVFRRKGHDVRAHLRALATGGSVEVSAHRRGEHQAVYPVRSFMRSAFDERRAEILARIHRALGDGIKG